MAYPCRGCSNTPSKHLLFGQILVILSKYLSSEQTPVILSKAKNLTLASETLPFAQAAKGQFRNFLSIRNLLRMIQTSHENEWQNQIRFVHRR